VAQSGNFAFIDSLIWWDFLVCKLNFFSTCILFLLYIQQ